MLLAWEQLNGRSGHAVGRALLEQLYLQKRGKKLPEIAETERGKPYFVDSDLHFSISHSKNHAFCCLSDAPVGIDAEEMNRKINPRLAEKILSSSEKMRFSACQDQRLALLRFWVLKEASAKLSGQGLRGYPNQTDFDPDDPRIRIIDGCYVAVLEQK